MHCTITDHTPMSHELYTHEPRAVHCTGIATSTRNLILGRSPLRAATQKSDLPFCSKGLTSLSSSLSDPSSTITEVTECSMVTESVASWCERLT